MHNMKGISSSDFECKNDLGAKAKLQQIQGANAISSEDLFGEQKVQSNSSTLEDKIYNAKELISGAVNKVVDFSRKVLNYGKQ